MAQTGVVRITRAWNADGSQTLTVEGLLPGRPELQEAAARRRERLGASDPDLDGPLGWLEETLKRI